MRVDVLVVGAGFSGSVVAERLASHGRKVLIIDKRPHIGGNAYDKTDEGRRLFQSPPNRLHRLFFDGERKYCHQ